MGGHPVRTVSFGQGADGSRTDGGGRKPFLDLQYRTGVRNDAEYSLHEGSDLYAYGDQYVYPSGLVLASGRGAALPGTPVYYLSGKRRVECVYASEFAA